MVWEANHCETCGAWVEDVKKHEEWHAELSRQWRAIYDEASRYKPPPTYGGSL